MKRLVPEGPVRDRLYDLHEAVGALVLLLMVARLARRLLLGVPAPEATLSAFDRRASLGTQFALYLLLFVVPVLGWAGTNAYGDPVSVFGLIDFPTILGKDTPLSSGFFSGISTAKSSSPSSPRCTRRARCTTVSSSATASSRGCFPGVESDARKRSFRAACGLRE